MDPRVWKRKTNMDGSSTLLQRKNRKERGPGQVMTEVLHAKASSGLGHKAMRYIEITLS